MPHAHHLICRLGCHQRRKQAGTSLIEFSIVAVPVLLVGLASLELAQWFFVKQAVSLALLEAARAGITQHANPSAIETAFERALLPLYPPTTTLSSRQRLQQALIQRQTQIAAPAWQIEIINPLETAFQDFTDPELRIGSAGGLAAINNNYQTEQDQRNRQKGWVDGLGPKSGLSIYHANILVLRVTYLHEPNLSGIKSLIKALPLDTSTYARHGMARGGYLPIQQEIQLNMQSHVVNWPSSNNGKIVRPISRWTQNETALSSSCQGVWCLDQGPTNTYKPPALGNMGADKPVEYYDTPTHSPWPAEGTPQPKPPSTGDPANAEPDLAIKPNDPSCGVSLCCLPGSG